MSAQTNKLLSRTVRSKIFLKVTALIIGYMLWSTLRGHFLTKVWVEVPLCFYNTEGKKLTAPEKISLELEGARSVVRHIPLDSLGVHIDAQNLQNGSHHIPILERHIPLPSSIRVRTMLPQSIHVTIVTGTQ